MDYIIETENLTKRYGTATVVDKVNLHVPKGKIYGLLGRNGAGKTTAMKMMLRLLSQRRERYACLAQTIRKISIPFIAK